MGISARNNPHSPEHTRVDSSPPKKYPPAPQSGANPGIRGNKTPGRTYCWTKGISLGADVSKHRLAKPGKTSACPGALDLFLEVPKIPFEMQKNLLCLRCSRGLGFFFLFFTPSPRSQGACEDEGWEWKPSLCHPWGHSRDRQKSLDGHSPADLLFLKRYFHSQRAAGGGNSPPG